MDFRLVFYNTGDTAEYQLKVREQLTVDVTESQEWYNEAVVEEEKAKTDFRRRKFLRENPSEVSTDNDRRLIGRETTYWKKKYKKMISKRKAAKKECDEAFKALESHKEEESRGFERENDIQKIGSQYKTLWTHLPA